MEMKCVQLRIQHLDLELVNLACLANNLGRSLAKLSAGFKENADLREARDKVTRLERRLRYSKRYKKRVSAVLS